MKQFILATLFGLISSFVFAQQKETIKTEPDPTKKLHLVDAACGQCRFHMQGKGCSLAVRMDGKAYFVDGTDIDSHGDAHADNGFCNKVRKAKVQGEVVNGRFKATYFQLISDGEKKGKR